MTVSEDNVLVLIPLYRDFFDDFEQKSLASVGRHLHHFPIAFVAPESLNTTFLESYRLAFKYDIFRFEDAYFKSIEGYNRLMLSPDFYEAFLDFEYILICQTDAYVFKNELDYWVKQHYDYIGAPWLDSKNTFLSHSLRFVFNKFKKIFGLKEKLYTHINKVGNGGFSLRRTALFNHIALKEKKQIAYFLSNKEKENYHIEDVFWSLFVPQKYDFKLPDYKTAVHFCVDRKPETAFELLNGKLPFACHGFNKKGVSQFWSKHIL